MLDYSGDATGKTLLADLREGKLTLPLVLTVAKHPELVAPLRRIYAGDREPVAAISRAVVESGACEEVRMRAHACTQAAVDALSELPLSAARTLLEKVAEQLVARLA